MDENQFEIVRAKTIDQIIQNEATTVTVIPYGLVGCGKVFSSMTFTDQESAKFPGRLITYGLRSVNSEVNNSASGWTVGSYTVPWMGGIDVFITLASKSRTKKPAAVPGVLVQICRNENQPQKRKWCQQSRTGQDGHAIFELLGTVTEP